MARAHLKIANKKDIYLCSTEIENLFINEFMPAAPGDYVKVYLYGLMYAKYKLDIEFSRIADQLGITEDEEIKAWEYWDRLGLIKANYGETESDIEIEFINLAEKIYGNNSEARTKTEQNVQAIDAEAAAGAAAAAVVDEEELPEQEQTLDIDEKIARAIDAEICGLYNQFEEMTGRPISQREMRKIQDAVKVYGITADVMSYAIKYSAELEKYNIDYCFKVALRWTEAGCRDILQVKEYLDQRSRKNEIYGMVFRELGFTRLTNPADREIMDRWIDEMGLSVKEIKDACRAAAGLREPTLRYVNRVLENRMLEAGGIDTKTVGRTGTHQQEAGGLSGGDNTNNKETKEARVSNKVLHDYYDYIRLEGDKRRDARIDEVCANIAEMRELFELENELTRDLFSGKFTGAGAEAKQAVREQRKELENDKRRVLVINGYDEDYLDRQYRCNVCNDTGFTKDGRVCVCSEARAEEAYRWYQKIKQN